MPLHTAFLDPYIQAGVQNNVQRTLNEQYPCVSKWHADGYEAKQPITITLVIQNTQMNPVPVLFGLAMASCNHSAQNLAI